METSIMRPDRTIEQVRIKDGINALYTPQKMFTHIMHWTML